MNASPYVDQSVTRAPALLVEPGLSPSRPAAWAWWFGLRVRGERSEPTHKDLAVGG